jgi:hypothetical protein
MSEGPQYSDEITQAEQRLGFTRQTLASPNYGEDLFALPSVQAVVYDLGPSDRIIKVDAGVYKHEAYGVLGSQPPEKAAWLPVGTMYYTDPAEAVNLARLEIDGHPPVNRMTPPSKSEE